MCSLLRQWRQEWLPGLSTPTHWQAVKKGGREREREKKKETCVRWLPNLKEKRRKKRKKRNKEAPS